METTGKKSPDYATVGLIAVLLVVFSVGQWMVVRALDARVGDLQSIIVNAVGRCETPADATAPIRKKNAHARPRENTAQPAGSAAPSGVPATAPAPAASK